MFTMMHPTIVQYKSEYRLHLYETVYNEQDLWKEAFRAQ